VKTFGFFIKDAQLINEAVLTTPYNHDDVAKILQLLITCLQEIRLFIGKEEEQPVIVKEEEFLYKI
jgi:hypothetical protein